MEILSSKTTLAKPKKRIHPFLWLLWIVTVGVGIGARVWDLSVPSYIIFDETHYVKAARAFLEHRNFFNDHPAFGKLLVGYGMYFLGDNPIGWRIVPAIIGCITLATAGVLTYLFFNSLPAALLCTAFLSLDGFLISYSRTAHMDGMMLFFALFGMLLAKYGQNRTILFALVSGMSIGFAGAMKINGLWALLPVCFIYFQQSRYIPQFCALLSSLCAYWACAVLAYHIMGSSNPFDAAVNWQQASLNFHTSSLTLHQFSSSWYTWPLMVKPILMHFGGVTTPGATIVTLANPFLIWASTLFLLLSLWSCIQMIFGEKPLIKVAAPGILPLYIGYFSNLIPWMIISRPAFFYHYLPSYAMLVIAVSGILPLWYQKHRFLVTLGVASILICGYVFLPVSSAQEMSASGLEARNWISCWFETCRWAP